MRWALTLLLCGTAAADVHVRLQQRGDAPVVSFGLPLPRGVKDERSLAFTVKGKPVSANLKVLLRTHDREGKPDGVRAVLVQLPKQFANAELDIAWQGGKNNRAQPMVPYSQVSFEAPVTTEVGRFEVVRENGELKLVGRDAQKKNLFTGRQPRTLAQFPPGYLATTEILGRQGTQVPVGLEFLPREFLDALPSALYQQPYPLVAEGVIDPTKQYDVWLYDRCTTALLGGGDFLDLAFRYCSFYQSQLDAHGLFRLKPQADSKYSHNRGLYAYYALTGDEAALTAGRATAEAALEDQNLVAPYRQGKLRGKSKLWTERGLAVALENLIYGHRLTDDLRYYQAFRELIASAYKHITADKKTLEQITGWDTLVPQNCLVHSAEQHEGDGGGTPFCSPWMSALMVDPLLQYLSETEDSRVDEILIRLSRWLRDGGTLYFTSDPADDSFLAPKACYQPGENARRLAPVYGGGKAADGKLIRTQEEHNDPEHCSDVTALTAAAWWALSRHPELDSGKFGPFPSERAALEQLHSELLFCARTALEDNHRKKRDPRSWDAASLARANADRPGWVQEAKIGFPAYKAALDRQFSWWFNTALEQLALLPGFKLRDPGVIKPCNSHDR